MTQTGEQTFFEAVGGHETFTRLVHRFYQNVSADPDLRALYPDEDLGPAETRLRMFLEQYWGGPRTYSDQRGHPRLGMRHAPFAVTPRMRDRWLRAMHDALDHAGMEPEQIQEFWEYVVRAANFLVNTHDESSPDDPSGPTRDAPEGSRRPTMLPLTSSAPNDR